MNEYISIECEAATKDGRVCASMRAFECDEIATALLGFDCAPENQFWILAYAMLGCAVCYVYISTAPLFAICYCRHYNRYIGFAVVAITRYLRLLLLIAVCVCSRDVSAQL